MKWSEAIALIDPTIREPGCRYIDPIWEGDVGPFASLLEIWDINWSEEFSKRMLKHWVQSWICTDTRVGIAVYCLDGEVVAVSHQPARKSDEVIQFLSKPAAMQVTRVLLQLREQQQGPEEYPLLDFESDAPDYSERGGTWGFRRGKEPSRDPGL